MNKADELTCFNKTIDKLTKGNGFEKSIAKKISGKHVERVIDENPDFAIWYYGGNRKKIVGVEHFRVNQFCKRKGGKIVSDFKDTSQRLIGSVVAVQSDYPDIQQGLCKETEKELANVCKSLLSSTYKSYIASWEHSANRHLNRIDTYMEKLQSIAGSNIEVELMLLIDITTNFEGWVAYDGKSPKRVDRSFIPIFKDVVNLLKRVPPDRVSHIILKFNTISDDADDFNVVVLRTIDIEGQLQKMGISVYEYAGEDSLWTEERINNRVNVACSRGDECFNVNFKVTFDTPIQYLLKAYSKAVSFKNKRVKFITSSTVCQWIEYFSDLILDDNPLFWQLWLAYHSNRNLIIEREQRLKLRLLL